MRWKKLFVRVSLVGLGVFGIVQLVPYGRDHANPPVVSEPAWDATTRQLAERACFDCHSNETRWPWYSNVAPMSWVIQDHVDEGRRVLNFSDWARGNAEAGEAGDEVREGEMPPRSYVLLHPEARLSERERVQLARGLDALVVTGRARED